MKTIKKGAYTEPNNGLALSVDEVCAQTGIKRGLFYRLLRENRGPRILKIGNRTLVRREELERWLIEVERRGMEGAS